MPVFILEHSKKITFAKECFGTFSTSFFTSFLESVLVAEIEFLFQSHICLPRCGIHMVLFDQLVNALHPYGFALLGGEILHILASCPVVHIGVLIENIKILVTKIIQRNFRRTFFAVLEPVNGLSLMENIVGADEQNVLFLEFLVIGSLGQSVRTCSGNSEHAWGGVSKRTPLWKGSSWVVASETTEIFSIFTFRIACKKSLATSTLLKTLQNMKLSVMSSSS